METKAKTKHKSKKLKKLNTNSFTLDLLDFELGASKEIAPYKCNACEAIFKRLSGYAIHNRYYANTGKCPKDIDLVRLNLRQIPHKANGYQYTCWELRPAVKPTGIKDELLLEMESIAFPNFNEFNK
jgi:hypothetical protein